MNPNAKHWPVPDDWTPEQALAAYDLISVIRELLWAEYEDQLLALMIDEDRQHFLDHQCSLDFDVDGNMADENNTNHLSND